MFINNHQEDAAGLFDPFPDPFSFKPDKHPVDYCMVVERSTREDYILNHPSVVGLLIILEENLTTNFLPKRITNFETNCRTIVLVSGTCLQNTPTKVPAFF